jgi:hypothetical protein
MTMSLGFDVRVGKPDIVTDVRVCAAGELDRRDCGFVGADLTNMVLLSVGVVLIQVVPDG